MRVGIMQPYIFPYIGYWQLIHAVDQFVILDDVNYIRRGYINRNSILLSGKPYRFTIPVKKASQNKLIKDMELDFDREKKDKFLMTIHGAYSKAKNYAKVFPFIEEIINNKEEDLTRFTEFSIRRIMKYLDISTELLLSSQVPKQEGIKGETRIIEICKRLHADTYINPCGGRKLYNQESFQLEGINLFFLDTASEKIVYDQNQKIFVENLSIIDILMFNNKDKVREFLKAIALNQ